MNPQKLAKWKQSLEDVNSDSTITHQLVNLARVRHIFSGVCKMVEDNPRLRQHSEFYYVFTENYAHSVLMYVRRQVRRDSKSMNLIKLADELHNESKNITMDYYVGLWTKNSINEIDRSERERMAKAEFLHRFGGNTKTHVDPAGIKDDITELESVFQKSSSFIDRRLAHQDKREPDHIPTLPEVETWCETLNATFKKYYLLLFCSDYVITPIFEHDWQAIFRVPWLPESTES